MKENKRIDLATIILIIAVNMLPLYFAATGRANVFLLVLLYWMESCVIGVFNVLRMAFARGSGSSFKDKIGIIPFFLIHYFGFMLGQRIVMFAFMGKFIEPQSFAGFSFKLSFWALALSHAVAFTLNYIGDGEYLRTDPRMQMFRPYGRVVVQQCVVLLGGFILERFNLQSATIFLVILIAGKTIADIGGYFIDRAFSG